MRIINTNPTDLKISESIFCKICAVMLVYSCNLYCWAKVKQINCQEILPATVSQDHILTWWHTHLTLTVTLTLNGSHLTATCSLPRRRHRTLTHIHVWVHVAYTCTRTGHFTTYSEKQEEITNNHKKKVNSVWLYPKFQIHAPMLVDAGFEPQHIATTTTTIKKNCTNNIRQQLLQSIFLLLSEAPLLFSLSFNVPPLIQLKALPKVYSSAFLLPYLPKSVWLLSHCDLLAED